MSTAEYRAMDISVVIPTFNRPDRVFHAVRSALEQSLAPREVVVQIDGATSDATTRARLATIDDNRLRVASSAEQLGNAEARNRAIGASKGEWIALLDDDDTWHPRKLEWQADAIARAMASDKFELGRVCVASCRLQAFTEHRTYRWPRLDPRPDEPIGDYLFCRRWPLSGDRLVQTSTIVAPRVLFDAVAFRDGKRFVDQDWLLRVADRGPTSLVFPETRLPLTYWDMTPGRHRVSHHLDWHWSLRWIARRRAITSKRARAAFLLTLASASAADAGNNRAFMPLLVAAFRLGRPNPAELLTHVANFALSRPNRDRIAARVNRLLGS